MSPLAAGDQLGRYRIVRRLGAGAMGEVYLAEDPQIERRLALKTVRVEEGTPQEIADRKLRLLREARAAGKLLHPNIVTLFDAGEDRGTLFLAFELVEGTDLAERIARGPQLSLGEALAIVRQVAAGLDAAHRQGIVHRDIKPSNIMITADGRVKVADFGIAKVLDASSELTMTGSVVGSPHYLSPEQIRGDALDGRTDIFSLGVLLYEVLCRRRPFEADTLTTLVYQILNKEPEPLVVQRPELGPRLERLVRRMLHKDRDQRFANAAELVAEIAACERELSPALLAGSAQPDALDDATRRLPDELSTEVRGAATPASTPAASPPAPGIAAPAPARDRRLYLVLAVALALLGLLVVAGLGARRWAAERAAPRQVVDLGAAREPEPPTGGGAVATSEDDGDPEDLAGTAAVATAAAREDSGPEDDSDPAHASAARFPFEPGERAVPQRPASVVTAPAPARAAAVLPPPEAAAAAPPVRPQEPQRASPEPEIESDEAPHADDARVTPRAAVRDALVAALPVQREMTTGMNLSIEVEPRQVAERVVVRLDRIVIGRAAEWNARRRGGRSYAVPEPGLHILSFLIDGAEIYRIRIDARPGAVGPTPVAVDLSRFGRRR
jgi:tRNA A-37 threonylcarbamoyl transferase component Bud32